MFLNSMTGFAQHRASCQGVDWVWELRSVNGKTLDLRFKMPPGFETGEAQLRNLAQQRLKRGTLQASLSVSSAGVRPAVVVNEAVLDYLANVAERLRLRLGGAPASIEALLSLRGVVEAAGPGQENIAEEVQQAVIQSFGQAVHGLAMNRAEEGRHLAATLTTQIERIEKLAAAARDCPGRQAEAVQARLREQVKRLLDSSTEIDPQRLYQEAALLATRADVQEELDRLFAHVAAVRLIIASQEPAGRKLEFLSQEFQREANTLCSKSSHIDLTAIGLELKTVIDQFREQVQNIE